MFDFVVHCLVVVVWSIEELVQISDFATDKKLSQSPHHTPTYTSTIHTQTHTHTKVLHT